ncbi:hypothetical protein [Celerinatantimonas sp. MCCC 1A17872]|uniref:hypothetical protein n=1 Tax=Celerinatantimonas sp. MCCC 1A17872 TaxID=3177514 RepID=UPI0038BF3AC4
MFFSKLVVLNKFTGKIRMINSHLKEGPIKKGKIKKVVYISIFLMLIILSFPFITNKLFINNYVMRDVCTSVLKTIVYEPLKMNLLDINDESDKLSLKEALDMINHKYSIFSSPVSINRLKNIDITVAKNEYSQQKYLEKIFIHISYRSDKTDFSQFKQKFTCVYVKDYFNRSYLYSLKFNNREVVNLSEFFLLHERPSRLTPLLELRKLNYIEKLMILFQIK